MFGRCSTGNLSSEVWFFYTWLIKRVSFPPQWESLPPIIEQLLHPILPLAGKRVQRVCDFPLQVGGELATLAAFLDLLVGELLGAGGDQFVIVDSELGEDGVERLGAVVAVGGGRFHWG